MWNCKVLRVVEHTSVPDELADAASDAWIGCREPPRAAAQARSATSAAMTWRAFAASRGFRSA